MIQYKAVQRERCGGSDCSDYDSADDFEDSCYGHHSYRKEYPVDEDTIDELSAASKKTALRKW